MEAVGQDHPMTTEHQVHCDCVRRMRASLLVHPTFDYAIINGLDESEPLPGWVTDQMTLVTCGTCGTEFFVGRIGELLLSIETSAKVERDQARTLAKQAAMFVGVMAMNHSVAAQEWFIAYEKQSKGWT